MKNIIFIFLLILLASLNISNAQEVITPNPVGEPGFETVSGWTYSEVDAGNDAFEGGQSTEAATVGTYGYLLGYRSTANFLINEYAQVSRDVNMTGIRSLTWDVKDYYSCSGIFANEVLIDNTVISSGQNLSSYSWTGLHSLKFRYRATDSGWISCQAPPDFRNNASRFSVDNITAYSNSLPTVPSLTTHANYHASASTTVSWSASTDSDSDPITYDVKVGTTSGGTNIINQVGNGITGSTSSISSNSFTMTPQNTYYWSSRSCDGTGCSAWATESSFAFSNNASTVPSISFPSNNSRHYNNTINYTWNISTDLDGDSITGYDFWLSNQSSFGYTVNRTNFTNNWTGGIVTTNGVTYYGKARSNDSYTYSSWSPTVQFTENTAPSVVNITLSPASPSVTSNLTVSMNGSDAEGDSLTNHYRWYKNGVLNNSWNDSTYVNATGNYTTGDQIYVIGYVRDGYENSTNLQSNSVIIGSTNSAPTFSGITLIPSTKKNNQIININASGITDDSSTWQLQTYYKNGSMNIYISNSSWVNTSSINITATVPFTTGGAHIIYGVIYDSGNVTNQSNLTSAESQATFTSLTTDPTIVSSSLSVSSITVGNTITITAQFNGQGANISSAKVNVRRPDATNANWTMTCGSGEIVNCTYGYDSTSDIGSYYIDYFYPTDTANITAQISSVLTFTASAASSGGGSSGGGGGGAAATPTPLMTSTVNLSLTTIGITDGARSISDVEKINKCLTDSFLLSNQCTGAAVIVLKQSVNWYTMLGTVIASIMTIYGLNLVARKKRSYLDVSIYSVIIIIFILMLNLMGFNMFLFNYLFNNSLSSFTFFSFALWGFVGTVILDELVFKKPIMWQGARKTII